MRIVSTTCSNTEIVCALGCSGFLVGVDRHSDYPEEVVSALPRVGPDLGIDPALVERLEPDIVLASLTVPGHERVVEALERAGLNVVAPEPTRLDDVYRDIIAIAERLGVPDRGAQLVAQMRREIVPRPVDPAATVLVEWWPKPVIVPGRHSWVTDLIELAGGRNPWRQDDVKSRPVEDDEVIAANPAAIVMAWCGVDPANYRETEVLKRAWGATRAFRDQRIHTIPEAYLGRPGPRLAAGYRALVDIIDRVRSEE